MLVRRVKENERMLKHMMSIVANLQDTYVSHMSFSGTSCPVVQSPTAMSESVAAARRRQRSPQSRNESILLENNEVLELFPFQEISIV